MKLIRQNITLDNWRKIYLLLQKISLTAIELNNNKNFLYDKSYVAIPIKNFSEDEMSNIYAVSRIAKGIKKINPSNSILSTDILNISRQITNFNVLKEYDTFFYILYLHKTEKFSFGIISSHLMGYLKTHKYVKQLYEVNINENK